MQYLSYHILLPPEWRSGACTPWVDALKERVQNHPRLEKYWQDVHGAASEDVWELPPEEAEAKTRDLIATCVDLLLGHRGDLGVERVRQALAADAWAGMEGDFEIASIPGPQGEWRSIATVYASSDGRGSMAYDCFVVIGRILHEEPTPTEALASCEKALRPYTVLGVYMDSDDPSKPDTRFAETYSAEDPEHAEEQAQNSGGEHLLVAGVVEGVVRVVR